MAPGPDAAPSVSSVVPADGATNVDPAAYVTVTFSEPVTAPASAFGLSCSASGAVPFALSGGPTTYTLDPTPALASGETCTVAVTAAQVADVDADDPPDTMAADFSSSFQVARIEACGDPTTPIAEIQGSGATSPKVGQVVSVEGVVVGDYQGSGQFSGYHLQDPVGDGDPATSEGLFVFNTSLAVDEGDLVRITGTVAEFPATNGNTQLSSITSRLVCGTGNTVAPTPVTLPVASLDVWESLESMHVSFPERPDRDRGVHPRPLRRGLALGRWPALPAHPPGRARPGGAGAAGAERPQPDPPRRRERPAEP